MRTAIVIVCTGGSWHEVGAEVISHSSVLTEAVALGRPCFSAPWASQRAVALVVSWCQGGALSPSTATEALDVATVASRLRMDALVAALCARQRQLRMRGHGGP